MVKRVILLSLSLSLLGMGLSFSGEAVKTITGTNQTSSNSSSEKGYLQQTSDLYREAINFESQGEVVAKPETGKKSQVEFFDIAGYLKLINQLHKENNFKALQAREIKVKVVKKNTSSQTGGGISNNVRMGVNNPPKITKKRVIGFCEFERDIEVWGRQKVYVNLPCYFEGLPGVSTLFGVLIPDLKNYSLILQPIEVYASDGTIYKVEAGYVLNAERSNPNVATEVNMRDIERILAKAGSDTAQEVKKYVNERLKNAGTQIEVYDGGTAVVKQSNFNIDIIGQGALITGIASLVEGFADLIKEKTQNIPITFRIRRGAYVFANLIISPEKEQITPSQLPPQKKKKTSKSKPALVSY